MDLRAIVRDLTNFPECDPPPEPAFPRLRWWERLLHVDEDLDQPEPEPLPVREWTPADVIALLGWLPDESACFASMQGGKHHRGWGQNRWMFKSTFDAVQTNTVVAMKIAAGKKAGRVKNATPWPTPDEQLQQAERRRPKTTVANLPKLRLGPTI